MLVSLFWRMCGIIQGQFEPGAIPRRSFQLELQSAIYVNKPPT